MRIKEIQSLIKFVAKSGASEVSLEMKDVKITIKTSSDKAPVVIQNPVAQPPQLSDINVVSPSIVSPPAVVPAVISAAVPVVVLAVLGLGRASAGPRLQGAGPGAAWEAAGR